MRVIAIAALLVALTVSADLYAQGCQGGCNLNARQTVNPEPAPVPSNLRNTAVPLDADLGWTKPDKVAARPMREDDLIKTAGFLRSREPEVKVVNGKDGRDGADGRDGKDGATVEEVLAALEASGKLNVTVDNSEVMSALSQISNALTSIDARVQANSDSIADLQKTPTTAPPTKQQRYFWDVAKK